MNLREMLEAYSNTRAYPFHMPGHKRRLDRAPYQIDITEISGFDDLHHAEGVLAQMEDRAAKLYHARETHLLVNGSTAGNLAAIHAALPRGGRLLLARNCHRSVYHAALLREAKLSYLLPEVNAHGIYLSVSPESVEEAFANANEPIQALVITSPTYEGVVSDIESIAKIVHKYGALLIVDEAHGAHFGREGFPDSAITLGADFVIQSLHKTMPALTQTALIHCNASEEVREKLRFYLRVFQTSSPSYVLMSSIDDCLHLMEEEGDALFKAYRKRLTDFDHYMKVHLPQEGAISIWYPEQEGEKVFAKDPSKIVLLTDPGQYGGEWVKSDLRDAYDIELEMASLAYTIAMTSVMDTEEGFSRLAEAIIEMNAEALTIDFSPKLDVCGIMREGLLLPEQCMDLAEAFEEKEQKTLAIEQAMDGISAEFVYIYPPGTPILVPGERISKEIVELIRIYKEEGLSIQGLSDQTSTRIKVV